MDSWKRELLRWRWDNQSLMLAAKIVGEENSQGDVILPGWRNPMLQS